MRTLSSRKRPVVRPTDRLEPEPYRRAEDIVIEDLKVRKSGRCQYPDADAPLTLQINDARAPPAVLRREGFDVDVDVVGNARKDGWLILFGPQTWPSAL